MTTPNCIFCLVTGLTSILLRVSFDPVQETGDPRVHSGEVWPSTTHAEGDNAHHVVLAIIEVQVVEGSTAVALVEGDTKAWYSAGVICAP